MRYEVQALTTGWLCSPALWNGLQLDDYYHRAAILGNSALPPLLGPPQSMFRFMRGDRARSQALMDIGMLPWWTAPELTAEFRQALTVQTHLLDYRQVPLRRAAGARLLALLARRTVPGTVACAPVLTIANPVIG